jgi:hypothetical protein
MNLTVGMSEFHIRYPTPTRNIIIRVVVKSVRLPVRVFETDPEGPELEC